MQQVIIDGVKIQYPDQQVFLWDENFFQLESGAGTKIGYNLSLLNTDTYENRSLSYRSGFSNKISVPLKEAIQSLYDDAGQVGGGHSFMSAVLTLYIDGVRTQHMWTWRMDVMEGRSLSYKIHGGNKIIHIYNPDELFQVQIYSDAVCDLWLGTTSYHIYKGLNTIDLSNSITTEGVYSLCFTQGTGGLVEIVSITDVTPSSAVIHLAYQVSDEDTGGTRKPNIYLGDELKNCYYLVYGQGMTWHNGALCQTMTNDGDFVEIRYRDTDGSRRYLGGKIISDELEYEGMDYNRIDPMMLFKKPLRYVMNHATNLTVGFVDLERASGFDEVLLSSLIEIRCAATQNQWRPCIIEDSIIRNGGEDRYDVELQIKVS